jgi:hypothetical protein
MALIECPDCGKQISDAAATCIHCGRPKDSSARKPFSEPIRSLPDATSLPHRLACPKCGSEQTVNVSLLQMRDTASVALGSVGAGYGRMGGSVNASVTQGQIQSNLAASLAPPQRRTQNFRVAGFLLFGAAILMGSTDSGAVGLVAIAGVIFYVIKQGMDINRYNQTEYLEAYEQWERKYLCQRCGNVFNGQR